MLDEVQWGRTTIYYSYQYKERKTLALHVHPDLTVTVDAPHGTTIDKIREKVKKRAAWIRKVRREFDLYLPKQPARQYINGEAHRYLGRQYRLKARKGKEDSVKCYRGYFHVTCEAKPTPKYIQALLQVWYESKAEQVFNIRYTECCKKVKGIGIEPGLFDIRGLRNRWGSCTKTGRIILNKELIKAPIECIDYVIMHELCHINEYHHGPRFWGLLKKIMPDYADRRDKLNLYADI